jgi:hypothetical protein
MTTARTRNELLRESDLALIIRAIEGKGPRAIASMIGLADIAELCRRHIPSHAGADWNERRNQILLIGIEWDLDRDILVEQSSTCLRAIAQVLS